MHSRNLMLVVGNRTHDPRDFVDIADRVARRAPDIRPHVVAARSRAEQLPAEVWVRPTLTVAFLRTHFVPRRGHVMDPQAIEKLEQADFLARMGVEVPHSARYEPGMSLPAVIWGDFVVLKPADLAQTSHGGVRLYRRSTLERRGLADFDPSHEVHRMPLIVQRFVETGTMPQKYRALTLCGEPLYVQHTVLATPMPPLSASDAALEAFDVSTGSGERQYRHGHYPDVLDFARRAASAFPNRPLLGVDIVRDVHDGRLAVLEVNAGGNVWHFSSPMWAARRAAQPEVARGMHDQLGAFDRAAEALIAATRRLAV